MRRLPISTSNRWRTQQGAGGPPPITLRQLEVKPDYRFFPKSRCAGRADAPRIFMHSCGPADPGTMDTGIGVRAAKRQGTVEEMADLNGRVELVTGGGRGIGRGIALALARAGCDVGVNYHRRQEDAESTASEVRALG